MSAAPSWGEFVTANRVPYWQDWDATSPPDGGGGTGGNPPGPDGQWVRVPRDAEVWIRIPRDT